jgi:hypothetical protein
MLVEEVMEAEVAEVVVILEDIMVEDIMIMADTAATIVVVCMFHFEDTMGGVITHFIGGVQ